MHKSSFLLNDVRLLFYMFTFFQWHPNADQRMTDKNVLETYQHQDP